jgi:UDP-N-acetylmuramyl pentapeptide phosphotransferase/UDP-N-acetylglucosamine-1-phosphate transferase
VVKLVPVAIELPPEDVVYQCMVPNVALADSVTVPDPHTDPFVTPEMSGVGITVAVTAVLLAVVHPLEVAST